MSTSDSSHDNSSEKSSADNAEAAAGSRTETRTTETTESEALTAEEEKVIRMRRGLAEDGDRELEFGEGADEATEEKLKQLEAFLVEAFESREAGERYLADADYGELEVDEAGGESAEASETKQKIIDELSDD